MKGLGSKQCIEGWFRTILEMLPGEKVFLMESNRYLCIPNVNKDVAEVNRAYRKYWKERNWLPKKLLTEEFDRKEELV